MNETFSQKSEAGIGQGSVLPDEQRATRQNWTLAPWNRWTFQRVQQFTCTARIAHAGAPSELPRSECDLGGIEFEDNAGRPCNVTEMLARSWTDGFLVMSHGEVLTEQYFNGMRADTLHLMMSCSKSFTSTLAGIFIEQGLLNLHEDVASYLPELRGTGIEGATLQQVLDMRCGVKFDEDYDDLDGDWRKCEVATGWREPYPGYDGPLDMLGYCNTLTERVAGHGGIFHYQSILTDVLGLCVERVTSRRFAGLFEQYIWKPIGAEQDLVSIIDSAGNAVFEGGFNVCLRDFARFAWLICQRGNWQGQQLVPHQWIDNCRFPGAELIDAFARSDYGDAVRGGAYHNQWWVREPDHGVLMALGVHGQTLYIDPEREFVAAKFSSQPAQADIALAQDQMLAFEAIADYLARRA